ncbi:MAG: lipopolysaccharide biosynthesis protein [Methanotrichaceae archaeon]|nr:lipopolysaccharide biosynthesis protein [Methanotrichaceae archaeon]
MLRRGLAWQKALGNPAHAVSDPLMRNSFFIGLSRAANKAIGLLFWSVAARYYSIADVGLGTAMISSLELVMILSRFGSDVSIIRFMPLRDKDVVFNSGLWIPAALSLAISLAFLATMDTISPDLSFIRDYSIFFIAICLAHSATLTIGYALISERRGGAYLSQNLLLSTRIPFLPILAGMGCIGIFFSLGAAYIIALVVSAVQISRNLRFRARIDRMFLEDTLRFSSLNYLASVLNAAPALILPIMILNMLGPIEAARWYVAFSVANIILIVPDAISTSFFVEGSHGRDMGKGIFRVLSHTFGLLLIPVVIVYIWGEEILGLLGPEYAKSIDLLRILVLGSFFVTVYSLYIPIQNIRARPGIVVLMNFARFVFLLGLSYIFIFSYGIIGVGYAWILTYAALSLAVACEAIRFGRAKKGIDLP